jgi:hypothetical protein
MGAGQLDDFPVNRPDVNRLILTIARIAYGPNPEFSRPRALVEVV